MGYIISFVTKSVRRRLPKYVSIIIAIGLGVTLFVSVDIAVNSLTEGIITSSSQSLGEFDISISNNTGKISNNVLNYIRENFNDKIVAATGRITLSTTIFANRTGQLEKDIDVIVFNTTDKDGEQKLGYLKNIDGRKINTTEIRDKKYVLIPEPLAEKLEVKKGDIIETNIPREYKNGTTLFVHVVFTVYDIISFEGKATESQGLTVWLSRSTYNAIADPDGVYWNYFDTIWISLSSNHNINPVDNNYAKKLAQEIKNSLINYLNDDSDDPSITVMAIRAEIEESIREGLNSFKIFLNMMATLIIIAGILLISNIQMISVEDREIQIGILRSLGAKKGEIIRIFILESVFLGLFGSVLGFFGGLVLGKYLALYINNIFQIGGTPIIVINKGTIITSIVSGILIAVATGIYPALKARSINIVEVLRGVKSYKEEKLSKKGFYFGWVSILFSIFLYLKLSRVSDGFILTKEGWRTIDAQFYSLLFLSALMLGLGLILSQFTSRNFALNLISLGYISVSVWWFRNGIQLLNESGNADKIFYVALLMLISGTVVVVGVNLEILGAFLRKTLALFEKTRAIGVISTRSMTSKKLRAVLTFSIFAIILSINVFAATWGVSVEKGSVDLWAFYSGRVDIIVDLDVPVNPAIYNYSQMIYRLDPHVTDVACTRHATGYAKTTSETLGTPFIPVDLYAWNSSIMKNQKGEYRFDIITNPVLKKQTTEQAIDTLPENEQLNISRNIWDLFFSGQNFTVDGEISNGTDALPPVILTGRRTITDENNTIILMTKYGAMKFRVLASVFNYGPSAFSFFPIIFIPERYVTFFEGFDYINYPNYYFIMTEYPLNDPAVRTLAQKIEKESNSADSDLRKLGYLVGALATPVWDYYQEFVKIYVGFLDFLQLFLSTGLLIGIIGLMVISLRNVAERKREIGMQRAIGFNRKQVVLSAIFEIFTLGFIGLIIGIINGLIMANSFTKLSKIDFYIPWARIWLYFAVTFFSAFFAGLIPGIKVARIPPSEALRYTG